VGTRLGARSCSYLVPVPRKNHEVHARYTCYIIMYGQIPGTIGQRSGVIYLINHKIFCIILVFVLIFYYFAPQEITLTDQKIEIVREAKNSLISRFL
jgi:hypothetical protein